MPEMQKNYRLGIDLGSTSLGWCMLELDDNNNPKEIINMGVRIFPDGRDAESHKPLAVKRRGYRSQRRNLDRYLERIRKLITYLMENGFLPEDERERNEVFQVNPYELRSKALDEPLSPAEFARALIHLAKKRGFKSNRKSVSDSDGKKLKAAIDNLKDELQKTGDRSLGEYLWHLYNQKTGNESHLKASIKFRYKDEGPQTKSIFPTREMVISEFEEIWSSQSKFNPRLTDEHKERIRDIIFFQRPLKPTSKGNCELLPEYQRAPKAHPLFQEFRIRQDLNNMRVVDFDNETHDLTDEQYQKLFNLLDRKEEVAFTSMKKELWGKQADEYQFNLEVSDRKKLQGNKTYHAFHNKKAGQLSHWWDSQNKETISKVIEVLVSDYDDDDTLQKLAKLGVDNAVASRLLEISLPDGYCRLSIEAMQRILPFMRDRMVFSDACKAAKIDHSEEWNGEVFPDGNLPYYGEKLKRESIELNRKTGDKLADKHGKINNPTVHVALNQLRLLVNALSVRYGAPKQIVLELGKEARMSADKINELNREIRKNEALNNKIRKFLKDHDQIINHDNMLKVRLWWELGDDPLERRCVYSGDQICVTELFSHNIEIDHILPFSRTYDDSNANKVLCTHWANQNKGNRSPFEAFGDSPGWQDILSRANKLKDSKKWRFRSDAMKNFEDEGEILARMLNDTRYMSRVAMKYMWYVCGKNNVWSVTGKHTGLLRAKWGLNSALGESDAKDRTDHRHHAIDAFVIALTTRSLVKRVSEKIANTQFRKIEKLDPPWPGFSHDEFRTRVNSIKVSYKPDQINPRALASRNQTGGALMKDTAYGFIKDSAGNIMTDPNNPRNCLYTLRKAVTDITEKNWESIALLDHDPRRMELAEIANRYSGNSFKEAVKDWARRWNISKVKMVFSKNSRGMVAIKDKQGRVFKYMFSEEKLFSDIFIKDPKDENGKWEIEIVNSHNAHQPGFTPKWKREYPKGKLLMRVYKNDIIAIDSGHDTREFLRVRMMTKDALYLRLINIAKKPKELEDIGEKYSARKLQKLRARKAGIDIIGRVFDPIVNEA